MPATAEDCNTAVVNFPRCASDNQTMFAQSSSYFCCEPGMLGVDPAKGKSGGLCEPSDQVVPQTLLATIASQVGIPSATPSTTGPRPSNATTTDASANQPAETNPVASPSSTCFLNDPTDACDSDDSSTSSWSRPAKIGVGSAVTFLFICFCIALCFCASWRRRNQVSMQTYGSDDELRQYDEYGNRIDVYKMGYVVRPGFRSYRQVDTPGNNVTVNVVQRDM